MKLLHSADWQLGLRLNFVGGEQAARLRAQRFDTVRRLAAVARERAVDVVVVAGDVFDDNGVGADSIQQARDALREFGDIPVVLLPGNHDPATPDSALARLGELPGAVHVAAARVPIRLAAGDIYPCPLTSRHTFDDPAHWLPQHEQHDRVRVVVAHGGALQFSEAVETPNRLDVQGVLARGYDYVALGDWHGTFAVNERAWYSGAPEATRFKEKRPGNVLLVEIAEPGAVPVVEVIPVARSRWIAEDFELVDDDDIERLRGWLDELPEKSWTLLELTLTGALSLEGRARLDALLEDYAGRLALLRLSEDAVSAAPTPADLAALHGEGYLGRAIEALRDSEDQEAADALRLLYRLSQERP
ncbi:MAG: metallophosphoesterase [Pseudomonadales bacterium]